MKITYGTNQELKDLYADEATLTERLEKLEYQSMVDPFNMRLKAEQLWTRGDIAKVQHDINKLNKRLSNGRPTDY